MVQSVTLSAAIVALISAAALFWYSPSHLESCKQATDHTAQPWDLFYNLGGYGPYVPKIDGVVANDTLPYGCQVEQVHMLARHSERFPTLLAGMRMLDLYHRIDKAQVHLNGSLEFVNLWSFLTGDPAQDFEQLTTTGPYAGSKTAFSLGSRLRTEYRDLRKSALADETKPFFWASDSQRVIETAKYFATAFFGLDWEQKANLNIIPEAHELGANTLTPGETCLKYDNEENDRGWNYGSRMAEAFKQPYLEAIRKRLLDENPGFAFSWQEIYVMQEMCGFQTQIQGHSPWCDVFSQEEWESYEYARDLLHYYRTGPGNPYAATMGWLWLNATADLLRDGPAVGPLFFSFVHDGDIFPMLTALELFQQPIPLPTSRISHDRTWRSSDTIPMGANIIFERLSCPLPQDCWISSPMYPNHVYCSPPIHEFFVRIKVNEGIVALPGCNSGAGQSCPLQDFLDRVKKRGEELEDFDALCGLPDTAPKRIEFLHQ